MALVLGSCKDDFNDVEVQKAPRVLSYQDQLEIIKNYMKIDTVRNSFSVTISDSIMQAENLTKENVIAILNNIAELNKKIENSIKLGEVTTLCLSSSKGFKTYTVNNKTNVKFADTLEPLQNVKTKITRGYPGMWFSNGNWTISDVTFTASDKVTSSFTVDNCRGYWQVVFRCYTGTSAYGDTYNQYGTGITYGGVKRFWWYTAGGGSCRWNFGSSAPVGGEANGGVTFSDTY